MKLIMDAICTHLMHVGMTSQQAMKKHPFNMLNVTVLLIFCIDESSNVLYLVRSAAGLREYMDAIYYFITGLAAALNFAWVTWKMPEVFRFIETLEDVVNTSEFNARIKIKFVRFFFETFQNRRFCRACESNIENYLHANQWKNKETCWNMQHCIDKGDSSGHHNATCSWLLCCLFHYWCGSRCFRATTYVYVVSFFCSFWGWIWMIFFSNSNNIFRVQVPVWCEKPGWVRIGRRNSICVHDKQQPHGAVCFGHCHCAMSDFNLHNQWYQVWVRRTQHKCKGKWKWFQNHSAI